MIHHDIAVRDLSWSAADEFPSSSSSSSSSFSSSSSSLRLELRRGQAGAERPSCGSISHGSYNTSLHVFALILILVLSTVACAFPLISRRTSKKSGSNNIIFICQHVGTGVLISTAFVHLLPTAFVSLTNPCLPYFWSTGYRPTAGLIAMTSAFIVVGIEMFLTTRGAGHSHDHSWEEEDQSEENSLILKAPQSPYANVGLNARPKTTKAMPPSVFLHDSESTDNLASGASLLVELTPRTAKPIDRNSNSDDEDDSDFDVNELDPEDDGYVAHRSSFQRSDLEDQPTHPEPQTSNAQSQSNVPNGEEQQRLLLQCMLLEAGILFHSVFIGMAISVSTGPAFVIFLVAIAFHQSFEGLALGSRIAAIAFPASSPKPWLMVLAYGTTTPIGQAIGLVARRFYDPQSQTGLLMVGVMNAISSGLLIFAGLVQLLAEDFLTKKSYHVLKGRRRAKAFGAVVGGAFLMALVGAWA